MSKLSSAPAEWIAKGIMYVEPQQTLTGRWYAGLKFFTHDNAHSQAWWLDSCEEDDDMKEMYMGIMELRRLRLLGRYGWLWKRWYKIDDRIDKTIDGDIFLFVKIKYYLPVLYYRVAWWWCRKRHGV